MTPKEIKALIPDTPIDGLIVEYWRIESADDDYPIHYICRYDINTPWKEHPWGKEGDSKGADFVDDWSIWVEYQPDTRAPDSSGRISGWAYLRSYLSRPDTYADVGSATAALIEKKEKASCAASRRVVKLQQEIGKLRERSRREKGESGESHDG